MSSNITSSILTVSVILPLASILLLLLLPLSPLLTLVTIILVVLLLRVVLLLIDLGEHSGHLLLEELLEFFLGLLIEVVLGAEVVGELDGGVALVYDDALLFVAAEIYVHKEERLLLLNGLL